MSEPARPLQEREVRLLPTITGEKPMDATRVQENFGECALGDQRLTRRALSLGMALSEHFGQALAMSFQSAPALKRAYEFSPMSKPVSRR